MRHRAGLVFVEALGANRGAGSAKGGGSEKVYLEDEEAIVRMFQEIRLQDKGTLKERLVKVSYGETGIINQKQFTEFLQKQLKTKENDLLKIVKVAGFTQIKS